MSVVTRSMVLAMAFMTVIALPRSGVAQQGAAAGDTAQIEQLQKQLTELQQQMASLQKTISSPTIPDSQRAMMSKHMDMMQQGWQGMHDQGCMMHPTEGCAHMGSGMGMGMGMGMKPKEQ